MSGPVPQKSAHSVTHNVPRRCSVQGDGSQYLQTQTNHSNMLNLQSRFHCIQKQPLRNFFSTPTVNLDSSHALPRPAIVQRSDIHSVESIDSTQPAVETARYKTELCRPFEETGQCRYGGKCQFAHGMPELRSLNRHPKYKTELCRTFHTTGFCSYGQRCNFIHNDEERRGPASSTTNGVPAPPPVSANPSASIMSLPISTSHTTTSSESTASSITSGSPSPIYLDEMYARLSPAPSFGSDGNSLASSISPPGSPKHELISDYTFSSLDVGFSLSQFSKLTV